VGGDCLPPVQVRRRAPARRLNDVLQRIIPAFLGLGLLVVLWQLAAINSKGFPTPLSTLDSALTLFADPFYRDGPNDMGIGWNVLASLQRVAVGFGLAALAGIPLGFLIGRFTFFSRMFTPADCAVAPGQPAGLAAHRPAVVPESGAGSSWTILSALSGRW
jgi:nitrate/nitrite transport system permease protein